VNRVGVHIRGGSSEHAYSTIGRSFPEIALTLAQGYEAARYAVLHSLAAVQYALGDLDRLEHVVQLIGFVNSAPGFSDQPRVINGATDLLVELYGDRGKPTRAAIGCQGLALNHSVEVVLTVLFAGTEMRPPLARDHYAR